MVRRGGIGGVGVDSSPLRLRVRIADLVGGVGKFWGEHASFIAALRIVLMGYESPRLPRNATTRTYHWGYAIRGRGGVVGDMPLGVGERAGEQSMQLAEIAAWCWDRVRLDAIGLGGIG